jgi:nicotinate-nucleotide adenylyltransferase
VNVGLLGGTFDPPHLGHLVLADQCASALALDQIAFVLAYRPPHKTDRTLTDFETRRRLLEAALAGDSRFTVLTLERQREGLSYTVETLRALHVTRPDDRFWLLLGEDSLGDLAHWREPEAIVGLARIAVYQRFGARRRMPGFLRGRVETVDGPRIEVSSTWVRAQVRAGGTVGYLVPAAVRDLIHREGLYRKAED